jgi:hypothetical protein
MPVHSRSKNRVAELVIGPATSGRTRWLACVTGNHVLKILQRKAWMAGPLPAEGLSLTLK